MGNKKEKWRHENRKCRKNPEQKFWLQLLTENKKMKAKTDKFVSAVKPGEKQRCWRLKQDVGA